ncbi:nitronate monooxygenase family protein [Celeribacter sp. PS-C1]|uniref:NAD(P)H-dependent flavin oxidoreductase n=1 Tax=Celeribacter sp. PS-C1 TaxID=2820813 RepID=UPI001CA4CBE4|nr:nitronate monooxygenase [Celeribacter sp. PS-C1]MBW6417036.1 nitronate monooxygenase [Celeribacter sp. PS-C1]
MKIETRLTRLLGIDLPICQAGMSWASSNSALPLAVARAGGLGVLAAGPMYLDALEQAIDEIRAGTDRPFAVNLPLYNKRAEEMMDLLEMKRVPILVCSQGGPKKYIDRFKAIGTRCLHVVAGETHAVKAMEAGVDGLVVVGGEAGGHPPPTQVSTLVLVRAVSHATEGRIPLIASGGFADGRGLLAALSLGADGANFGTRFIATPEAGVSVGYKEAVLGARVADTVCVGQGLGMIRAIRNPFTDRMVDLENSGASLDDRRDVFAGATLKMAALDGDVEGGKLEAGQSTGLVGAIKPAHLVVEEIAEDYLRALAALPGRTFLNGRYSYDEGEKVNG